MRSVKTSSLILLAKTGIQNRYIFGAYKDNGEATSFLSLPEDRKMFIETLTGKQTIMGYKTLQATPFDFPDGGRICITHHPGKVKAPGLAASTIEDALELAFRRAAKLDQDTVYVTGGASIMEQCMERGLLDEVILTLTETYAAPVSNPVYLDFVLNRWNILEDSGMRISKNSDPPNLEYHYLTLKKMV
ncbi:MAG: dihydrofolate reductase [Chitinophagaceae bacterium]|nr:dihydrofolate reductase [Chitinophagaceae bacterium]